MRWCTQRGQTGKVSWLTLQPSTSTLRPDFTVSLALLLQHNQSHTDRHELSATIQLHGQLFLTPSPCITAALSCLQVCPRYLTTLTADQDFAGQVPHPHTAAKETLVWSCSPGACLFVYHYTRKPWEGQDVNTCGSSFPPIHAWSSSVKKKPSLSAFYLDWSCIRFSALHPFSRL